MTRLLSISAAALLSGCVMNQREIERADLATLTSEIRAKSWSTPPEDPYILSLRQEAMSKIDTTEWTDSQRAMVARGVVATGMTGNMVKIAWGLPNYTSTSHSPYGRTDVWEWGSRGSFMYRSVWYREGRVSWWHAGE
jgi:hypothetical protein